ncbi:MAG: hypothetical protein RR716_06825 [Christensenellaceae bacterium]
MKIASTIKNSKPHLFSTDGTEMNELVMKCKQGFARSDGRQNRDETISE